MGERHGEGALRRWWMGRRMGLLQSEFVGIGEAARALEMGGWYGWYGKSGWQAGKRPVLIAAATMHDCKSISYSAGEYSFRQY